MTRHLVTGDPLEAKSEDAVGDPNLASNGATELNDRMKKSVFGD
jgi:hypothetical protein